MTVVTYPKNGPNPAAEPAAGKVSEVFGSWQVNGAFQNGTPYSGQADLREDWHFQMSYQGTVTALGTWRYDPQARNLVLDGQHGLYGYLQVFRCNLIAQTKRQDTFRGSCSDSLGTGTLQLTHY